jgi:hypothetical protein
MKTKFLISEVPDSMTVTEYISSQTDYKMLTQTVVPKLVPVGTKNIVFENIDIDASQLWDSTSTALEIYGDHGWIKSDQDGNSSASEIYTGFSLMYNPNHSDVMNLHQSSLGTNKLVDFKFYQNDIVHKKNTYLDTLGFRLRTPASTTGYLGQFLSSFNSSLTRGRMSIIHADKFEDASQLKMYGWHHDEPIFENLRLNIPMLTDPIFKFQIKDGRPYHLAVGNSYSWDTAIMHRVFSDQIADKIRAHLVIGISPWFDYDESDDSWNINEFYGTMHPFDMLVGGHVVPGLKFKEAN